MSCVRVRPPLADIAIAGASLTMLLVLLGGVAVGRFYAVEAAAAGAFALFAAGLLSGGIRLKDLDAMLSEVLVTTGALFAPLLAATTFTLIVRLLGTDKLIGGWVTGLPGGEVTAIAIVLGSIGLAAFVLDAFEIIFVVVPILIPPLLLRVPDAVWVSVLVLLTLQASFLLPPVGYALMMTRTVMGRGAGTGSGTPLWPVIKALAPFLLTQFLVLALVLAVPALVHIGEPAGARSRNAPATSISPDEAARRMRQLTPPPGAGLPPFAAPPPPGAAK